jgi:hypothetical protein
MDPLHPIEPIRRRVPPLERLPRISREGDRPERDPSSRERQQPSPPPEPEREDGGEGHVDVRA